MMRFVGGVLTHGTQSHIKWPQGVNLSTDEDGNLIVDLGQKWAWDHCIVIPRTVLEKAK